MGGAAKSVGSAVSSGGGSVVKSLGGGGLLSTAGNILTGTSGDAGILGVGQFKGNGANIDANAFKDDKESEARQQQFANQLASAKNRDAPEMKAAKVGNEERVKAAQIATKAQDQTRGLQMNLANQLAAQAAGQGPSLAQSQLQNATNRNVAQAMAMAASQRGQTAGQGLRQIAQQASAANQQAAAQSAALRMEEQMAARQQLAGVAQAAREQDLGLATSQADLTQQAHLANQDANNQFALAQAQLTQQARANNQQAELAQTGMNDAQSRFFNSGLMEMEQRDREAAMALEQLKVQEVAGLNNVNATGYANASKARGDLVGNIGSGIAAAFSDEELKEDIKDGENRTQKFLKSFSESLKTSSAPAPAQQESGR